MKNILILLLSLSTLPVAAGKEPLDCENVVGTLELNECAALEEQAALEKMERYLTASLERWQEDEHLISAIKSAQESWQTYRDKHCGSIYTQWRDGTIRGAPLFFVPYIS